MKKNNQADNQIELEQMSDRQLQELLHKELGNKSLDGDYIRLILKVLKEREPERDLELSENCQTAWDTFKVNCVEDRKRIDSKPQQKRRSWLLRAATVAAVLTILVFTVPTVSGAENIVEMFSRWTGSIFDLFNPNAVQPSYVFKTENPGLQQVYDAVKNLGITQPVVPMWIPEGYELTEIKTTNTPTKVKVYAVFAKADDRIVFLLNLYGAEAPYKYETEEAGTRKLEIEEIAHYIERNEDAWVAVWSRDNVQCSLTVDCQEDTLYKVLKSIYKLEVS